ncbi:hypothetical protein [Alkalimarinus coralli]|uniref:hypothetical protein n=1 Tax=Alkalimarinus coralli TaxID=2935863 RepID=UPI00202B66E0|nr:hypothetical protein [Alkalimarinus coralli]
MNWLKALRLRLITRFSTKRKIISSDQFLELESYSLYLQVIVGRDCCRYIGLNLRHVPKNKREQALKHQVAAQSMWNRTDYCVAWESGFAQVWFWDADAIEDVLQQQRKGFAFARIQSPSFFSEVVLWEKPVSSCVTLFKCASGYDLQNWQDGILLSSQWYAHLPSLQQVNRFIRSQGLACRQSPLEAIAPLESEALWAGVARPVWNQWFEKKRKVAFVVAAIFLLVTSLQITSIARWSIIERDIQQEIANLEGSANNLLEARSQARKALLKISDIKKLFVMPDTLTTQLQVYRRIPESLNLRLKKWERNIEQIEMTVEGEIVDTLSLVRALDGEGFTDVNVTRSRIKGQYNIKLKVTEPLGSIVEGRE